MSVYKREGSPFYSFDFQFRGIRFSGFTKATSKREAEAVEKIEKEKAKASFDANQLSRSAPLTIGTAAQRYWIEVGQHHSGAETTLTKS